MKWATRSRALVGFLATVVVATGLSVIAAPAGPAAAAAGEGAIGGTVTVPPGYDVTDVAVWVVDAATTSVVAGPLSPDVVGVYNFTGVADGQYTVFAEAYGSGLVWQWAGAGRDASEASDFAVTDGSAVPGVDFNLEVGGVISGTVTVPAGYGPDIAMTFVERPAGSPAVAPTGSTTESAKLYTEVSADGTYAVTGLATLPWQVRFSSMGGWLYPQLYSGVYEAADATSVNVTLGANTSGIDATLEETHRVDITGTLKDAASSLCYVVTRTDDAISFTGCTDAGTATHNQLVPAGDYIVSAYESHTTHGDTAVLWWNDTAADRTVEANATAFSPEPLSEDVHPTAEFDFTGLAWPGDTPATGSISLDLTNWDDGLAASGGCMQVFDAAQALIDQDCVGSDGTYTVADLEPAEYRVKLINFTGAAPTQWFYRVATFAAAQPITIAGGTNFTDAYALLRPYSIVGRVVDANGDPLTGGTLIVWSSGSQSGGYSERERIAIDPDGTFATGNVGTFPRLWFHGFDGLADVRFGGSTSTSASTPTVRPDVVIGNPEAVIVGSLTAPPYFTSTSVCVFAYEHAQYGHPVSQACGAVGDPFELQNLAAGPYAIRMIDSGDPNNIRTAQADFWGEGNGTGWRHPVEGTVQTTVTAGEISNVNIAWGGTITAAPTIAGLPALEGGCMDVYAGSSGPLIASDCDPVAGNFSVNLTRDSDWLSGHYRVRFRDVVGGLDKWHSNALTQSNASWVRVHAGATVPLTVELAPSWGRVGGVISLPDGTTATEGCVTVISEDFETFFETTCADPVSGEYLITVPIGTYFLEFWTNTTDVAFEYHSDALSLADATTVDIASGALVTVNADLMTAAEITGTVSLTGGAPADACVGVYELDNDFIYARCTNDLGQYVLDSLRPGTYYLSFFAPEGWANEWHDNSHLIDNATPVTIAVGESKTVDATLAPASTLAGVVKSTSGAVATGGCVYAYVISGEDYVINGYDCVDSTGAYSIQVPPGTPHRLLFQGFYAGATPLADTWSGGSATLEGASSWTAPLGSTVTANANLASAGASRGTIALRRYSGSYGDVSGCAHLYTDDGGFVGTYCSTDSDKKLHPHIRTALSYSIYAFDLPAPYQDQWYGIADSFDSSTSVRGTKIATFLEVLVRHNVSFSGQVVLPEGVSSSGWVAVFGPGQEFATWAEVQPDRTFVVDDVFSDLAYTFQVVDFAGLAFRWVSNQQGPEDRNVYSISSTAALTNPHRDLPTVTLEREGVIVGHIKHNPGDFGATYACVTVTNPNQSANSNQHCGPVGSYFAIRNLPAGYYRTLVTYNTGSHSWMSDIGEMDSSDHWSFVRVEPESITYLTPRTVTVAPDSPSVPAGGDAAITVKLSPAGTGTAALQYWSGSSWEYYGGGFAYIVNGEGRMTWKPTAPLTYRIWSGQVFSAPFTIAVASHKVTAVPDSETIPTSGTAGAVVTLDPTSSGAAYLQYKSGSTWVEFANPVTVSNGVGHLTWTPSKTYEYRFRFGNGYSLAFTIAVDPPTFSATADSASIPAGGTAGATVTVEPALSGPAYLQYKSGGTWYQFANPVTVTNGTGHLTWVPSKTYEYRFKFGTYFSDPFTITVVPPTVTGTPTSASIPAGGTAGATINVDPAVSGAAFFQYWTGTTWVQFATPVNVVDGVGSLTWQPSRTFTYRFKYGTQFSDPFTITVTPPTVTATRDAASISAGEAAGATVNVSPSANGQAFFQYKSGTSWIEFAAPVTVTDGVGYLTWSPSRTFEYRFRFGAVYSSPFTITVTPPTVTATADSSSIPTGGTAGATVNIDPAVSGAAFFQYWTGSTWVQFPTPVTVTGGEGHLTWTPSKTYTYRFKYGTEFSSPFTITVTPPTVTATRDAASIAPGGTAGATVNVTPSANGQAYFQYKSGTTWIEFATPVTITDGVGHLTWTPSRTFEYRFRFGPVYSSPFTITVV
ncbi:MAG: hypothetical protein CVT64_10370 [Actinobacteria bacterium HGW-Actinobacteria-4]|nr:MAG: hypothetical protein CVT64_10370 [Actinobacteria bacterium HGW-Actinobacteria-4]